MISGSNENIMTGWKNYFSSIDIHFGNFMSSFVEKNRELIYTGITRARADVDIWSSEDLLFNAILRRISRKSGLADSLRVVNPE